ncbi:hypothetical protein A33M_2943 [Rhodovulum sp. PH10]|nr:hypothetical protein A33M_2943 [Rhodovulum sp. PH10]
MQCLRHRASPGRDLFSCPTVASLFRHNHRLRAIPLARRAATDGRARRAQPIDAASVGSDAPPPRSPECEKA